MSRVQYHVAKGHTLVIGTKAEDELTEFTPITLEQHDRETTRILALGVIKPGGGPNSVAPPAELELVAADHAVKPAPKSAKPTGKAREAVIRVNDTDLLVADVLAAAFAAFGGTVAAWNKLDEAGRGVRLENSALELAGVEDPDDEDPADEDPADEDPADEDPDDEDPDDEDPADEDPDDEGPADEDPDDEDPADEDPDDEDPDDEGPAANPAPASV